MISALSPGRPNLFRSQLSLPALVRILLDPVVILGSLYAVTAIYEVKFDGSYFVLALIIFSMTFPGASYFSSPKATMVRDILLDWVLLCSVLLIFGYAIRYLASYPRDVVIAWSVATPLALIAAHSVARVLLPKLSELKGNQRTAIIVGANDLGQRLARSIADNPYLGISVAGFLDDRAQPRLGDLHRLPLHGRLDQLAGIVATLRPELIYITLPLSSQPRILNLLDSMRDTTASIYFVPDIFVADLIQARVDDVAGLPVVAVCETPFHGLNGLIKRTSDIVLSSVILLLLLPLMLIIAISVKLSSPGPILFRQRRYGLNGREIVVYKFRSMMVMEDGQMIEQARRNDPRVTGFGAFLRRTSMDELPQFFNVLQGRMSIVGPRPHAVAHNELYRKLIKGYMMRHKVRPGITGWAQVNGLRGETESLEKMRARIEKDLEYLRNWSLKLDLQIILRSILVVFKDSRRVY